MYLAGVGASTNVYSKIKSRGSLISIPQRCISVDRQAEDLDCTSLDDLASPFTVV